MSIRTRWHPIALAAVLGAGIVGFGGTASADGAAPAAGSADGSARTGKSLKDQIAPPGVCASASRSTVAGGGGGSGSGGGGCAIGSASEHFSPIQVAAGPQELAPPAPGPPPIIPLFVTNEPPVGGPPPVAPPAPPPPPVITIIESPAVPDPLPGLIK